MPQTEFYLHLFELINDYTCHKILQRRFLSILQKSIDGEALCPPQFASSVIKFVGEDLDAECGRKIIANLSTAAADRIIAEHPELFSDVTYDKSFRVSTLERLPFIVNEMGDVIFKERKNVGTVAAFLAFGATIAAYCKQRLGDIAIEKIVNSVAEYVDCHLGLWLKRNGGLSMVQSAKQESCFYFTGSRTRKADFLDSLKHLAQHTMQTENPHFYTEMCQLISDLESVLEMKKKASDQETGREQFPSFSCDEAHIGEKNNADQHMKNKEVVPPEINLRGQVALEAYYKAVSDGKTCVKRVPVMFIGQDRAGKTSLKNALMGQRFNPAEVSTVGIDVDPSLFEISTEIWRPGEKNSERRSQRRVSFEHCAARLIVNKLTFEENATYERIEKATQSENTPLTDTAFSNAQTSGAFNEISSEVRNGDGHNINVQRIEMSGGATEPHQISREVESHKMMNVRDEASLVDIAGATQASLGNSSKIEKIPGEIEDLIKKLLQEGDQLEDEDDIFATLWDFGGQSVYYTTHPLFLTSKAIYLLAYDLSRNPYERAEPVVKQGLYKEIEDVFSTKTNLDYLDFWLTSVASLNSRDDEVQMHSGPRSDVLPEKLPCVFLVCTHADEPYNRREPHVAAREVFGSLQTKEYKKQLYDDVFVVDNTKSGLESECPEVTRLREKVLAVSRELPQMKEVIPIRWLKFEKAVQVAVEEGYKWISLERAKEIAYEVCKIDDYQEFVTLLNFLHDQRILIHFDDTVVLNSMVILDPQWLIDVFKKVITVQPYAHESKEVKELWHKLETTGILSKKLLERCWVPLLDNQDTFESLIAIMEKFSLLCPCPSSDSSCTKEYLVPSMLLSYPPQDVVKLVASSRIPSVFLRFKTGQVPPGLFPRLILQFYQWGKTEFWSPVNPQLYLNFARFYTFGDQDCSVILLCHSKSIEIVFHRGNFVVESVENLHLTPNSSARGPYDAFEVACACAVCRQLGLMLECMRNEFQWLRNMKYELGVICPVCCYGSVVNYCRTHHKRDCEQEECLHFWSESDLRAADRVVCTKSAAALNNKVDVNLLAPWLATEDKQLATDERDGRLIGPNNGGKETKSSLVISDVVVESLLSGDSTCEPKEIVRQLQENLQWEQDSLKNPTPENKRLIRYLATKAKHSNRTDVVKLLREITPAGTTGPLLHEHLDIRNIPVRLMREITIDLSGGGEWTKVAEKLGLSASEIRFLESRTLNPCDSALAFSAQRSYINVGYLYDVLTECGLPVIADLL